MSNRKRKRNRHSASRPTSNGARSAKAAPSAAGAAAPTRDRAVRRERAGATVEETRPRTRGLFGARFREVSPYPGLVESVGRGTAALAASPAAMAVAFLAVLVLWATYVAAGAADFMGTRAMSTLLTVPPLYILLNDRVIAFFPIVSDSLAAGFGLAVALSLFRGLVVGAVVAIVARRLAPDVSPPAARAFARAVLALLLVSLAFFGAAAALPYAVGGFLPGNLGGLLLLAGPLLALYFLAFAPVIAVVEGAGYRESIRRSARAARLPGGAHIALTFGYFAATLFLVSIIPARVVEPATPSISTWAIALAATFLHMAVMGAFVYRWMAVRDRVVAEARPARASASTD